MSVIAKLASAFRWKMENAAINTKNHKLVSCELSRVFVLKSYFLFLHFTLSLVLTHDIKTVQHTIYCDFLTPFPLTELLCSLCVLSSLSIPSLRSDTKANEADLNAPAQLKACGLAFFFSSYN